MTVKMTALQAIRAKCLDCCCNNAAEVAQCPCTNCTLYPFRFGKNPYNKKREYSEEYKAALRERMKLLAEEKKKAKGM